MKGTKVMCTQMTDEEWEAYLNSEEQLYLDEQPTSLSSDESDEEDESFNLSDADYFADLYDSEFVDYSDNENYQDDTDESDNKPKSDEYSVSY